MLTKICLSLMYETETSAHCKGYINNVNPFIWCWNTQVLGNNIMESYGCTLVKTSWKVMAVRLLKVMAVRLFKYSNKFVLTAFSA